MFKVLLTAVLCLYLSSINSRTFPKETEQETLNRVSASTDTIFKGRILRKQIIDEGIVYPDGDNFIAAIIEVEVLKVYRGEIKKNDKQTICTWSSPEATGLGYKIDQELFFFGVRGNNNLVLIPDSYGYIMNGIEKESRLLTALKLKPNIFKNLFKTTSGLNPVRNVCYEPITWPELSK